MLTQPGDAAARCTGVRPKGQGQWSSQWDRCSGAGCPAWPGLAKPSKGGMFHGQSKVTSSW